jgi:hypothetical protein
LESDTNLKDWALSYVPFFLNNQLLQMLSWEKGKALSCFGGLLIVDKKEMLGATE